MAKARKTQGRIIKSAMKPALDRDVQYVLDCIREAEDATRDQREAWAELWDLYQNKQDYSNKKRWQSKVFIPKIFMTVEQAAAMVKRAVMSVNRLFTMTPKDPNNQVAVQFQSQVERSFAEQLSKSNFPDAYGEMIKSGFLLGLGVPKVLWDGNGKRLVFGNVKADHCYIDPYFQPGVHPYPKFIVEHKMMDLADFREEAKAINQEAGKPIYDMAEINKIEGGFTDNDTQEEDRTHLGISDFSSQSPKVCLHEFWGTVVSEDGMTKKPNQLIVVANKQYKVRKQDNPFDHKRPPYLPTYPIPYPHRGVGGVSLVAPVATLQYAYNNLFNMVMDNLNFTVNKSFEINTAAVLNASTLTDIYPGKLIHKNGPNAAVTPMETTQIGQDSFLTMQLIESEIQRGTAVTEFVMGLSGVSKTATEAQLKTSQAQGIFDVIARNIEIHSLKPLLEMALDVLIQYGVIPMQVKGLYDITVGGLTLLLQRQEQIQQIQGVLGMALQMPSLGQMTNIPMLFKKLLNLYNLGDVYQENVNIQAPTMEQQQAIHQQAMNDAKQFVQRVQTQGVTE